MSTACNSRDFQNCHESVDSSVRFITNFLFMVFVVGSIGFICVKYVDKRSQMHELENQIVRLNAEINNKDIEINNLIVSLQTEALARISDSCHISQMKLQQPSVGQVIVMDKDTVNNALPECQTVQLAVRPSNHDYKLAGGCLPYIPTRPVDTKPGSARFQTRRPEATAMSSTPNN